MYFFMFWIYLIYSTAKVALIDLCVCSRDGDKMAPAVEKKIAELEMGLLHLQQNIDIPEISLAIHPIVAQVVYSSNC